MLDNTSLILSFDSDAKGDAASPEEIPLQLERCQISERKLSELRYQVIGHHASRTILGRFGHQRHEERFVGVLHVFVEVCC